MIEYFSKSKTYGADDEDTAVTITENNTTLSVRFKGDAQKALNKAYVVIGLDADEKRMYFIKSTAAEGYTVSKKSGTSSNSYTRAKNPTLVKKFKKIAKTDKVLRNLKRNSKGEYFIDISPDDDMSFLE